MRSIVVLEALSATTRFSKRSGNLRGELSRRGREAHGTADHRLRRLHNGFSGGPDVHSDAEPSGPRHIRKVCRTDNHAVRIFRLSWRARFNSDYQTIASRR